MDNRNPYPKIGFTIPYHNEAEAAYVSCWSFFSILPTSNFDVSLKKHW